MIVLPLNNLPGSLRISYTFQLKRNDHRPEFKLRNPAKTFINATIYRKQNTSLARKLINNLQTAHSQNNHIKPPGQQTHPYNRGPRRRYRHNRIYTSRQPPMQNERKKSTAPSSPGNIKRVNYQNCQPHAYISTPPATHIYNTSPNETHARLGGGSN